MFAGQVRRVKREYILLFVYNLIYPVRNENTAEVSYKELPTKDENVKTITL